MDARHREHRRRAGAAPAGSAGDVRCGLVAQRRSALAGRGAGRPRAAGRRQARRGGGPVAYGSGTTTAAQPAPGRSRSRSAAGDDAAPGDRAARGRTDQCGAGRAIGGSRETARRPEDGRGPRRLPPRPRAAAAAQSRVWPYPVFQPQHAGEDRAGDRHARLRRAAGRGDGSFRTGGRGAGPRPDRRGRGVLREGHRRAAADQRRVSAQPPCLHRTVGHPRDRPADGDQRRAGATGDPARPRDRRGPAHGQARRGAGEIAGGRTAQRRPRLAYVAQPPARSRAAVEVQLPVGAARRTRDVARLAGRHLPADPRPQRESFTHGSAAAAVPADHAGQPEPAARRRPAGGVGERAGCGGILPTSFLGAGTASTPPARGGIPCGGRHRVRWR